MLYNYILKLSYSFNILFFFSSIVIKAFKTQLSREQLWNLPSFYRCGNVAAPFNKYWSQQYHKAR